MKCLSGTRWAVQIREWESPQTVALRGQKNDASRAQDGTLPHTTAPVSSFGFSWLIFNEYKCYESGGEHMTLINVSLSQLELLQERRTRAESVYYEVEQLSLLRFHVILIKTLRSIPCSADTMLLQGVFFGTPPVSLQFNKTLPPADSLCLFCIKSHSNPVTISSSPLEKGSAEMAAVFWVAAEKKTCSVPLFDNFSLHPPVFYTI